VIYPKRQLSGCKLTTLDSESFLGVLPDPPFVQFVAVAFSAFPNIGSAKLAVSSSRESSPIQPTSSTMLAGSFATASHLNNGPPANSINADAQSIIDLVHAGASVLSFDSLIVALLAAFGVIRAIGITTIILVGFALGRINR
jgi:hypothetical protein